MNEWNHDAKRLLEGGRDAFTPEQDRRERVRAKLAATLGAAAFSAAVAAEATAPAAKLNKLLFAKLMVPVGLAALVLAAVALMWPKPPAQVGAKSAASAAAQVAASVPTAAHIIESDTTPREVAPPSSVATQTPSLAMAAPTPSAPLVRTRPSPSAATLAFAPPSGEIPLVAAMDAALRARQLGEAQRLITEHARRYPKGQLVEERLAAEVIVSCLNAAPAAVAKTQAFLRAYPKSPHRSRILDACPAATGPRP